jgi:hypothetical protein
MAKRCILQPGILGFFAGLTENWNTSRVMVCSLE